MKKSAVAGQSITITGFTLVELLVVIATVALLMGILLPALNSARKHSKKMICMSNLRQLMMAWTAYADSFDGKIVNAGEGEPARGRSYSGENPWCGYDWYQDMTKQEKIDEMSKGALYPYVRNINLYRCAEARKEMNRTYSIVCSMNGLWGAAGFPSRAVTIKKMEQIKDPKRRIVFVEERWPPSPDSFIVSCRRDMWFPTDDVVCVHPGKSANFVFADGHVYNKKWEEEGTRNNCQKEFGDSGGSPDIPYTKDLYWLQYVAWGDFDLVGFLTSAAEVRKVNYDY